MGWVVGEGWDVLPTEQERSLCTSIANNPELLSHLFLKNQPEEIKESDKPQNIPATEKKKRKTTLEERCRESFERNYKKFSEEHSDQTKLRHHACY